MTRKNIDIPDDLWHRVYQEAAKQNKTRRDIVIEALEEYVEGREGER